ncbi:hypothetical protein ACIPZ5_21525 [Pseudomonas sp. NPDC089428]|uniref:hypothetical protein n=1 Tax=Pseudomonas sp. NPDC089428 TaxID=3364467 RepID=UPI0038131F3C
MNIFECAGLKLNEEARQQAGAKEEQWFTVTWKRPNEAYETHEGADAFIDYEYNAGHIQLVGNIIRKHSWLVLNIPNNYDDGTHEIITFDEKLSGKEGVVLSGVLDQMIMNDWRGKLTFERKEKFTATFNAVSEGGYEIQEASMEFNSYKK